MLHTTRRSLSHVHDHISPAQLCLLILLLAWDSRSFLIWSLSPAASRPKQRHFHPPSLDPTLPAGAHHCFPGVPPSFLGPSALVLLGPLPQLRVGQVPPLQPAAKPSLILLPSPCPPPFAQISDCSFQAINEGLRNLAGTKGQTEKQQRQRISAVSLGPEGPSWGEQLPAMSLPREGLHLLQCTLRHRPSGAGSQLVATLCVPSWRRIFMNTRLSGCLKADSVLSPPGAEGSVSARPAQGVPMLSAASRGSASVRVLPRLPNSCLYA